MSEISGVHCAAATPLTQAGGPDHAAFAAHAGALLAEGCHGLALLGTMGEANSFSLAERTTILERAVEAGLAPDRLMPGTATPNIPDTVALTRHAVAVGVRAVVLLPPFYYKGVSDAGLFEAYARIIEGVGDDRLRIVLYHIPQMSGVPLGQGVVARLRAAFPATVVGIKDSSGELDNMRRTLAECPGIGVLAGADPLMLPVLQAGGAGCITASANLIAGDLRIVYDGWSDPGQADRVAAAQARIEAWRALTNAYGQLPTVKAMVARRRGDEGWCRVRPPLVALDAAQRESVWQRMDALDAGEPA